MYFVKHEMDISEFMKKFLGLIFSLDYELINYFHASSSLATWMVFLEPRLESSGVSDMVPPKDPYIKVRVLEEIGEVLLSDQIANLAMHSILFLKRIDAESFISQVFL
ncbi:putative GINS complex, subunit Psf1 protein [Helianthus annuus]|nr:putative GINS complex, subunit Psf1 protein [Helianthus annuus]